MKLSKKLFKMLTFLTFFLLFVGCWEQEPQISVQEYNNLLISYQIQAVDEVEKYFSSLEKDYNGENLSQIYIHMRDSLNALADKIQEQEARKGDIRLKNAVANYLSGLQSALNEYEMPVVEMLGAYSGQASELYRKDKQKITEYTLKFANILAQLDKQLEEQQVIFAHQHKYAIQ